MITRAEVVIHATRQHLEAPATTDGRPATPVRTEGSWSGDPVVADPVTVQGALDASLAERLHCPKVRAESPAR